MFDGARASARAFRASLRDQSRVPALVVQLPLIAQLLQASVQYERSVFPASVFVKRYVSCAPAGQI